MASARRPPAARPRRRADLDRITAPTWSSSASWTRKRPRRTPARRRHHGRNVRRDPQGRPSTPLEAPATFNHTLRSFIAKGNMIRVRPHRCPARCITDLSMAIVELDGVARPSVAGGDATWSPCSPSPITRASPALSPMDRQARRHRGTRTMIAFRSLYGDLGAGYEASVTDPIRRRSVRLVERMARRPVARRGLRPRCPLPRNGPTSEMRACSASTSRSRTVGSVATSAALTASSAVVPVAGADVQHARRHHPAHRPDRRRYGFTRRRANDAHPVAPSYAGAIEDGDPWPTLPKARRRRDCEFCDRAVPVEGGYRVAGRKIFASLSGAAAPQRVSVRATPIAYQTRRCRGSTSKASGTHSGPRPPTPDLVMRDVSSIELMDPAGLFDGPPAPSILHDARCRLSLMRGIAGAAATYLIGDGQPGGQRERRSSSKAGPR